MVGEAGEVTADSLPQLLLVSDVNAERTAGGALVLFRLLQTYPADRLRVVSFPTAGWPGPAARLPGVEYRTLEYSLPRVVFNRFNPFWPAVMARLVVGKAAAVTAGHPACAAVCCATASSIHRRMAARGTRLA